MLTSRPQVFKKRTAAPDAVIAPSTVVRGDCKSAPLMQAKTKRFEQVSGGFPGLPATEEPVRVLPYRTQEVRAHS